MLIGSNPKCRLPCSCKQNCQKQRGFSVVSGFCGQQRDKEHRFLPKEGSPWAATSDSARNESRELLLCLQPFLCWAASQPGFSRSQFIYFQDAFGPVAFNLIIRSFQNILSYLVNLPSVSRFQVACEAHTGPILIFKPTGGGREDAQRHFGCVHMARRLRGAAGKEAQPAG